MADAAQIKPDGTGVLPFILPVICGNVACRRSWVRACHFHDGIGQP
jgi:hypothetical protein